jgi:hypothetical protein
MDRKEASFFVLLLLIFWPLYPVLGLTRRPQMDLGLTTALHRPASVALILSLSLSLGVPVGALPFSFQQEPLNKRTSMCAVRLCLLKVAVDIVPPFIFNKSAF